MFGWLSGVLQGDPFFHTSQEQHGDRSGILRGTEEAFFSEVVFF